jgi:hypothetical protein
MSRLNRADRQTSPGTVIRILTARIPTVSIKVSCFRDSERPPAR